MNNRLLERVKALELKKIPELILTTEQRKKVELFFSNTKDMYFMIDNLATYSPTIINNILAMPHGAVRESPIF